jgi:hypothetical protein
MHQKLGMRTSHRTRAKRWDLVLLWVAGMLVLALATAVWIVVVYRMLGV